MRISKAAALATFGACLGVAVAACVDLFHSTTDVLTACELDAATSGCDTLAQADAGPDFCTWSPAVARQTAAHACAWLGACETPLGQNAFGVCMFQALLAYDCTSNPNHRVQGEVHRLWSCLATAQTCDDVNLCLMPPGTPVCQGDYVVCGTRPNADGINGVVLVACSDAGARGEDCALWGQACITTNSVAACGDPGGTLCAGGAVPNQCSGSQLSCPGGALAFDCSGNGAKACAGFPSAAPRWVACIPDETDGSAPCTPDAAAACSAGVASSCPTGVTEGIDCAALLALTDAGADAGAVASAACQNGPLSPPFDWSSPCAVIPPQCSADSCEDGDAASPALLGCVRGATFSLDCAAQGLRPCHLVATRGGAEQHPACAPP